MSVRYPTDDGELRDAVRADTSYDDTDDELPQSQLDAIVERSKGRMELATGSDAWYMDDGLGFALVAYTCMRAKAAVENISLSSYSLGAEDVEFHHADPDESMQLQQWAEDVRIGLDASDRDDSGNLQMADGAGYVGENYYYGDRNHRPY
jgi:hypothetical protein